MGTAEVDAQGLRDERVDVLGYIRWLPAIMATNNRDKCVEAGSECTSKTY